MTEQLRSAADQLDAAWNNYSRAYLALRKTQIQESHGRGFSPDLARSLDTEWAFISSLSPKVEQTKLAICRDRNYSSGLAPINSLPPEILTRIFQLVDRPCQSHKLGPDNALLYPDNLAHVCLLWRQIAISCPFLWSHIDLAHEYGWYKRLIDRAEVYSDRTDWVPIELHVTDGYDSDEEIHDHHQLHTFLQQISHLVETLQIVANSTLGSFHRTLFEGLFCQDDSDIRKLVLHSHGGYSDTFLLPTYTGSVQSGHLKLDLTEHQFARGFSTINVLHAHGIFPIWSSTAYHGLVDLRLLSTSKSFGIEEAEIRSILQSSPGLRILHFGLDIHGKAPEANRVTRVFLQNLEVVRVFSAGQTYRPLRSSSIIRLLSPGKKPLQLFLEDRYIYGLPDNLHTDLDDFLSRANVVQIYIKGLPPPLSLLLRHSAHLECLIISHFNAQYHRRVRASLSRTDELDSLGYFQSLRIRESRLSQDDLRTLLLYCPAGIVLEESYIHHENHGLSGSQLSAEQLSFAFPEVNIASGSGRHPMTAWDDGC